MKDRGQYASILMPSRAEFYYPHQWELCYHHYKYNVAMPDFAGVTVKCGRFRPYQGQEDIDKLAAVYEKFLQNKHGYVVRSRENWQQLIDSYAVEEGYSYILEDDGQPIGYILYTLQERKLTVREMAYISQQAQSSLFRFIYNHRSQADEVEWYAPLDDLTYFRLPDPKKNVTLYPFMTGRIVDVQKAMESLTCPSDAVYRFSLSVIDPLAAWNNRCFAISIIDGKVTVEVLEHQTYDIQCTIGAFSQLFFGRLNAAELQYMGRLQGKEQTVKFLDKLFPKCCNYINEYF
jgi:predicted acetyltransferase